MSSLKRPPPPVTQPPPKQRKCGVCGGFGHDRRNCRAINSATADSPIANRAVGQNVVTDVGSPPPLVLTAVQKASSVDWERVLYVVFDLETTGRSRQRDEIIELAAMVLDPNGVHIEDATFSEFVKPKAPISAFITHLTSITNDDVRQAEPFPIVGDAFIRFMQQQADDYSTSHEKIIEHVILVGHNGKVFDIPFFVQQLSVNHMSSTLFYREWAGRR
jgi:hypothetical protein